MMASIYNWVKKNKVASVFLFVFFLQRIILLIQLGPEYNLNSDDIGYINSGIHFWQTGEIIMHGVRSAQIMPGMPVLIGLFSAIFGTGFYLYLSLKITWMFMGLAAILFVYKTACIHLPKWAANIAVFFFVTPDFAWMDQTVLTETPFQLCFVLMIYSTVQMAKTHRKKYFWICLIFYFFGLMLKANIGIYPLFAAVYLLLMKYNWKLLIKQGLILGAVVLCFVIPWSIRNYCVFHDFIPLTYGAGNPVLLGTYQGWGYPSDAELDYQKNVDEIMKEKYAWYYKNGKDQEPHIKKYLSLQKDVVKAQYRLREWWEKNPESFLSSFFVVKPKSMVYSTFYWKEVFDFPAESILVYRHIDFTLCIISVFLSLIIRKMRRFVLFLGGTYAVNILLYSMTFSFSRYAQTLLFLRYIMAAVAVFLLWRLLKGLYCSFKETALYSFMFVDSKK